MLDATEQPVAKSLQAAHVQMLNLGIERIQPLVILQQKINLDL